jgi:hypothetical protein
VIYSIFNDQGISKIDEIILTGGEPLLAIDEIWELAKVAGKQFEVSHFRVNSSLILEDAERSFAALDELFAKASDPELNVLFQSVSSYHRKPEESVVELASSRSYFNNLSAEITAQNNPGGQLIGCGRSAGAPGAINVKYEDGFAVSDNGETVFGFVSISHDGRVFSSCDLSYELFDKFVKPFGSVMENDLSMIIKQNSKPRDKIRLIELPSTNRLSFSNYWNNLTEEQRGQWFGYAMSQLYGIDMPGYGIFRLIELYEQARECKQLESFKVLKDLYCISRPVFVNDIDFHAYRQHVIIELVGYINLNLQYVYAYSPLLQMADIYYRDMPYSADVRLKPIFDRIFCVPQELTPRKK